MTALNDKFWLEWAERNKPSRQDVKTRARILNKYLDKDTNSVLEYGCGAGKTLMALNIACLGADILGVEPSKAMRSASIRAGFKVAPDLSTVGDGEYDAVVTWGSLIYVPPAELPKVLSELVRVCRGDIVLVEYFNAEPVEIDHRGVSLYKCDFGQAVLENCSGWKPLECDFYWSELWPEDDVTAWHFKKD